VIKAWRDKATQRIFDGYYTRSIPKNLHRKAERQLRRLNAITTLADIRVPPSNRLEKLKGNKNRWSIRINQQYRITFDWIDGNAYEVWAGDYHK